MQGTGSKIRSVVVVLLGSIAMPSEVFSSSKDEFILRYAPYC
jgi:hypothetical protein